MEKVIIPSNLLEKEAYAALPPLQKEEYIQNLLVEFLKINPMGLVVSDIQKNSYLSHSVVWHHLEVLASRGDCLRIERGDADAYHLNRVIDYLPQFDMGEENSSYRFAYNLDLVENIYGRFLRIQRLRESRTKAHTIRAGIIIPLNLLDKVVSNLVEINETLNKGENPKL